MRTTVLELFNEFLKEIPQNNYYRALTAIQLFDFLDNLRLNKFPQNWLNTLKQNLSCLQNFIHFCGNSFEFSQNSFNDWNSTESKPEMEQKTGRVYFDLWKDFKQEEYYAQTATLLSERVEKNDLQFNSFDNVLDDGCGGGRYSLTLKSLGCKRVTGIDISSDSIEFAKKMNSFPEEEVKFIQGSVLDLPFDNEWFDFVFSNGVLHHTTSTEQGLSEIFRVLKPGGKCWLYLYGGKNSLFWDITDFCRALLKNIPQNYTQSLMKVLGYPPGRIFHRNDFFYVPIHHRYYEREVAAMLEKAGFTNYRRLKRGVAFDWDEIIFNNPKIDPYIYGEGEMRFWIEK